MESIINNLDNFFSQLLENSFVKLGIDIFAKYDMYIYICSGLILVIAIFYSFLNGNKRKYEQIVDQLELKKMNIINLPVPFEISKLSYAISNREVEEKMKEWKKEWRDIELELYDVVSQKILELDGLVELRTFKNIEETIEEIDTLIDKNHVKAKNILEDILQISKNENKSRQKVTKIKSKFREIKENYKTNEKSFEICGERAKLLFDEINDKIIEIEDLIQNNDYSVVDVLMKNLNSDIAYANEIIERFPIIIDLAKNTVQNKLVDVLEEHRRVENKELNLKFLDFRRNYDVGINKLESIFSRLKVLDLENVEIELTGIIKYCDSITERLGVEEKAYEFYRDNDPVIISKIKELQKTIADLDEELITIRKKYEFKTSILDEIKDGLDQTITYYRTLVDKIDSSEVSYSEADELIRDVIIKIKRIEKKLLKINQKSSDLREDETRAFEQLDQMQSLISSARNLVKISKLDSMPGTYDVYLKDAVEAVNNVVLQINSAPLDIEVLNTRVSTARDLTLKYYNYTRAYVKTSFIAEKSILYGNRYRSSHPFVNDGLKKSTSLFESGKYRESITSSMEVLERIEPGIYDKLNDYFSSNMRESNL